MRGRKRGARRRVERISRAKSFNTLYHVLQIPVLITPRLVNTVDELSFERVDHVRRNEKRKYRWARVRDPVMMDCMEMERCAVPLSEDRVDILQTNLDWGDFCWSSSGVEVRCSEVDGAETPSASGGGGRGRGRRGRGRRGSSSSSPKASAAAAAASGTQMYELRTVRFVQNHPEVGPPFDEPVSVGEAGLRAMIADLAVRTEEDKARTAEEAAFEAKMESETPDGWGPAAQIAWDIGIASLKPGRGRGRPPGRGFRGGISWRG